MPVSIELQNPANISGLPELKEFQEWAETALEDDRTDIVSLVVRVVDEEESAELNHNFRHKNGPTNVLSFPYELPEFIRQLPDIHEQQHLGDLVLCEPLVKQEAKQQNKILRQHWAHLIIHGVLHLQGYDHLEAAEAEVMENSEIKLMKQLGFNNPYENE